MAAYRQPLVGEGIYLKVSLPDFEASMVEAAVAEAYMRGLADGRRMMEPKQKVTK